jgi:hypothetical protein
LPAAECPADDERLPRHVREAVLLEVDARGDDVQRPDSTTTTDLVDVGGGPESGPGHPYHRDG